ncbi:MAG: hypothetical protein ACYSUV_21550 [Planctomycetota bacterium]|jgi:hypothetical protein
MSQPVDKLKMRKESELELLLYEQIEQAGLPLPDWQRPTKGHKFDFTWGDRRILCEVQGGTEGYGRGRGAHVREPGYSQDRMYSNRRQMEGWLVLEFTKRIIESGQALELLREVLG